MFLAIISHSICVILIILWNDFEFASQLLFE